MDIYNKVQTHPTSAGGKPVHDRDFGEEQYDDLEDWYDQKIRNLVHDGKVNSEDAIRDFETMWMVYELSEDGWSNEGSQGYSDSVKDYVFSWLGQGRPNESESSDRRFQDFVLQFYDTVNRESEIEEEIYEMLGIEQEEAEHAESAPEAYDRGEETAVRGDLVETGMTDVEPGKEEAAGD